MSAAWRVFEYFIAVLFSSLVLVILAQIVFRYFIGSSLSWADEGARYLFVWLVYLSGVLAAREGLNITFEMILEALPRPVWLVLFVASNIVVCAFLALAVWLGIEATAEMRQVSSILRIPMKYVYLAIPIGCFGMFLAQISFCVKRLKDPRHPHLDVT
ncbi:TRAP transporter small permease [Consotaella salsifontis]|uniref:TRAP transporter small permease protein n=1 Tax=Consotaella salsifontis TaxID=1365950 RepID=A0A1T4SFT7_9HYPH|nr:TRAP transporter small permease [Consotaella salsifontis]SKA27016.1 TRAP-type C4-dicarboxylate transport system, small permease component [Consotaella salsifontis]